MTPQQARESTARVAARAAELMVAFPEASANECLHVSMMEERFIYGDPSDVAPRGLLGWDPLEDLRTGGER